MILVQEDATPKPELAPASWKEAGAISQVVTESRVQWECGSYH